MNNYGDLDLKVVRQEVITPIRYKVFNYEVDEFVNNPHIGENVNQRVMIEFLRTDVGKTVLDLGVAVSVEKYDDYASFRTRYTVMAHFTPEQHHEFEKEKMWRILQGKET